MRSNPIARLGRLLKADPDGDIIAEILGHMISEPAPRNALVAVLAELRVDNTSGQRVKATGVQRALLDMVIDAESLSTDEVMEKAIEYGYRSLGHKQHASSSLNQAVGMGLLGKVRTPGGVVRFSPPRVAVREALKRIRKLPEECGPRDLTTVSRLTGLDIKVVSNLLTTWNEMSGERDHGRAR